MSEKIICLMGPTAAGKTDLAIELTQQLPCDIVSVDSAMIYRDMNIGTAKPSMAELAIAPHRLIDIRDPSESYSVADFCDDAQQEIAAIQAQGRIPLLVGGTMMYFNALQQGLAELPEADVKVRQQLATEAEQIGWSAMHEKLQQIDPLAAEKIHPNDPQRIQRALEVFEITGQPISELQSQAQQQVQDDQFINFAIAPDDRSELHRRIALRFDQMLQNGFIEEVEQLFKRGDLSPELPSMRAVGYRQVWDYISGISVYDDMRELGIIATRQLAKRQLTWLRGWPEVNWLKNSQDGAIDQVLNRLDG